MKGGFSFLFNPVVSESEKNQATQEEPETQESNIEEQEQTSGVPPPRYNQIVDYKGGKKGGGYGCPFKGGKRNKKRNATKRKHKKGGMLGVLGTAMAPLALISMSNTAKKRMNKKHKDMKTKRRHRKH
tara:strand:+ start:1060 stop:1443 length:384 start_codon:yes stop_codon:yes gene_type:complete